MLSNHHSCVVLTHVQQSICQPILHYEQQACHDQKCHRCVSLICRASGELDGHEGDPSGGDGVPAQVLGCHHGGATQRRGAVRGGCQEDSGHGERKNTHTYAPAASQDTHT